MCMTLTQKQPNSIECTFNLLSSELYNNFKLCFTQIFKRNYYLLLLSGTDWQHFSAQENH